MVLNNMSEEEKAIKRLKEITNNYSLNSEDLHYAIVLYHLIMNLQQENQQLKEQVEYLRRSCERKEDAIISLEQDLTIIDELEKWCKSFTTEEFNYNFLVVRIKDILEKISELKGEKNE